MRFVDLGLKMGDVMQLQLSADSQSRYPVQLYGFLPDCSVIISSPMTEANKSLFVREGQMVTLRFVVHNVASGFTAKVLSSRTLPMPYLHLEMPKQVEAIEVRSALRVDVDILGKAVNTTRKSPTFEVHISNLSISGGRIESDRKVALIDDCLDLSLSLKVEDIERTITLKCDVKNQGAKDDDAFEHNAGVQAKHWYGLCYTSLNDVDKLLLSSFIYQEMLKSLHIL